MIDLLDRFSPSLQILARFAYRQDADFFPDVCGTLADVLALRPGDPVARDVEVSILEDATAYLASRQPGAVVSVHPLAGAVAAEAKRKAAAAAPSTPYLCATCVLDWAPGPIWLHPGTDAYFVASFEAKDELIARGAAWGSVHVTGIPLADGFAVPLGQAAARARQGLADRFSVLLMAECMSSKEAGGVASAIAGAGVQVIAVAGRQQKLRDRLFEIARTSPDVHAYGWTDDIPDLMAAANVLVARGGGITMAEAAAVGLPQILVGAIPEQELNNVDFLVDSGAALLARDEEDLRTKVSFLAHHPERLAELAADAARLGRRDAAKQVSERVLDALRRRLEG